MSIFKTGFLMTALTILLVLLGRAIGGQSGLIYAFVFAVLMNFGSYWFSDKIVLAIYRAKEVNPNEAPELYLALTHLFTNESNALKRWLVIIKK